ncbi:hypothetical protein BH23CHL8_BH23CHL8_05840 [soil metagenome]
MTSELSLGRRRLNVERRAAIALGSRLVEASDDPEAFLETLEQGFARLRDPGSPPDHAMRAPLRRLVRARLGSSLVGASSSSALNVAARLERSTSREVRLFALPFLERALEVEPERAWQSLRRLGRGSQDRIEVDALAVVWAQGVLGERFRWAELEQLVYSARAMERRLVAATLASIPVRLPEAERGQLRDDLGRHVLPTLAMLMGDADDAVQRALGRAIRAWTPLDPSAIEAFLRDQAAIAGEHRDGYRARVVRDALRGQPDAVAADLRRLLTGLRRRPGDPSSSLAARQAAAFTVALSDDFGAAHAVQGERFARSRA